MKEAIQISMECLKRNQQRKQGDSKSNEQMRNVQCDRNQGRVSKGTEKAMSNAIESLRKTILKRVCCI